MSNVAKKIELITNVSIIVVSVVLCVFIVQFFVLGKKSSGPKDVPVGSKISVEGVNFNKSKHTLLAGLSTNCKYCSDSSPFYKRLLDATANRSDVQVVALFSQSVDEAKKYVDSNGAPFKDVKQVSLSSLKLPGTPTLILVDNNGQVVKSWVGMLTPDREAEVLNSIK